MKIKFLGAHNAISSRTGFVTVLIDDIMAVDAGSLVSTLSFKDQKKIKAILLTHQHYDHMRDVPAIGMSMAMMKSSIDVYGAEPVRNALFTYLINDPLYMDFTKKPKDNPSMRIHTIEPGKKETIAGYEVLPVPVMHSVLATGFQITSPDGKKVFITSDTGPGLAETWRQISPDTLITEVTTLNKGDEFARDHGHLTPALLQKELESFKTIHNYLPKIVLMHLNPFDEKAIKNELRVVEKALKTKIAVSYEGMTIRL
jgi:ribonuclease BN (tRNA processing enzyme)